MSIKRPLDQIGPETAIALPARPLGERELAVIQHVVQAIAPDWSVELQGICADETTLVVLPQTGDDAVGPTFVISRESYGLRVDQLHWDELTEVGLFTSLDDVLDALRIRLTFCVAGSFPPKVMLH